MTRRKCSVKIIMIGGGGGGGTGGGGKRMTCSKCSEEMIMVGRQYQSGKGADKVWLNGYLCPTPRCPTYGQLDSQGRAGFWPNMTLDPAQMAHAMILGAMAFRDSTVKG